MNAKEDEDFIRQCIELARQSVKAGDWPFGAVLVKNGVVVAEGLNTAASQDITGHAEVNVIKKALDKDQTLDLSQCVLYSSFEPCPMCSFLIREYGVGRVVYSLPSPHWGGSSRWRILHDEIPSHAFAKARKLRPPEVQGGILAEEVAKIFEELGWAMHKQL